MLSTSIAALCAALLASSHDGPDPIGSWSLSSADFDGARLEAVLGVQGRAEGPLAFVEDAHGDALYFDGRATRVVLATDHATSEQRLPTRHMTIEAWASVNTPAAWGGLLGLLQDNGDAEAGWILGYDGKVFTFGLASKGADDGNGQITYMQGKTPYEIGVLHHVVGTFDGETMKLYVDGELDAESEAQSGDILYPDHAELVLGGYVDRNESFFHNGRLRSVRLFDRAASSGWVRAGFAHGRELRHADPYLWIDPELRWVVQPYLQWATKDGMTIRWETSRPGSSEIRFGRAVEFSGEGDARVGLLPKLKSDASLVLHHELRLEGLEPETAYYYQAVTHDDLGRELASTFLSFQTACVGDTPFAFAVISDTQGNPSVNGRIAQLAWAQRPSFVLHPGDLVDTGSVKSQWVHEFFGSMQPLFERVAFFPVLGNHEQDARLYYEYMSLPDPEYHYTFVYGNAQFFMLDSNRQVGPGTRQYKWLSGELARSRATWKLVIYHHPAYTSDENDYGDTWSGPSTRGDMRVRALVPLFDKHGVDIVWNGHIHSYERTWPLRDDRARQSQDGTVYMITGGGGGSLETAGPIRPFFQNNVRHGHHYCMVAINGKTLEMKAFDLDDRLFDSLVIGK
jgi:predicted phosphodiesterase